MAELHDRTLGRYQIVSLRGRGGMAEVYKAYQPSLDRYVAIKVLHPHLADETGFISRFEREAAAVARLRHPNIVQVIDFDCQEGQYYMVMEYIEGLTLKETMEARLEQGEGYTLEEAAYLVGSVASALNYAHGRGMVHRDVKPGNIMIAGEGQVVLTDFGIAHMVGTTLYTERGDVMGTPAYMAPEQGRGSVGDARSDIYSLGVVLYQIVTGRLPYEAETPLGLIQQHIEAPLPAPRVANPELPEAVESVILKTLAKDPGERYQTAEGMATALLQAAGLKVIQAMGVGAFPLVTERPVEREEPVKPLPQCPYRGLFAFREEDAPLFFGRETFTDQLIEAAEGQPLVAVVGPSGSGKSSVVFAGLLPHLRQAEGLRGTQGRAWLVADCRPGAEPFYALASALAPLFQKEASEVDQLVETRKLARALESEEVLLSDVMARTLKKSPEHGRLLLVVDQFEELYTLVAEDETRRRFVDTLLEGVGKGAAFTLLLTLRADFLGQALSHRGFADALQKADLKLGPMTRWELSQAVESPARKLGVGFEAGLVERILDDVGDEPGNLPLLEFALTQLWEQQKAGQLSHEAFEAIGRVEGALARYADQVFQRLDETRQKQARHVFTQVVRPGEGTEDTRRLALREELGEEHWALVRELADARLVVTGQEAAGGQETVEVVHEALIQRWGQLREWMMVDRAFRTWQERLRAAIRGWEASGRDEGALLRGVPLFEAQRWLTERGEVLSELEVTYVQDSVNLRDRQQAEIERRRRITIFALAGGMLIAIILALVAFQQRQGALTQARIAMVRELTLASQTSLEVDPELSILLGLQSASVWDDLDRPMPNDLQYLLHQAIQASRARLTWSWGEEAILAVGFIQPGDLPRVVTADPQTGSVSIWDPEANQRLMTIPDAVMASPLSPDGRTIAVSAQDNTVRLLDTASGQVLASLAGHSAGVSAAAFSPDGQYLLTRSQSEYIVWQVESGRKMLEIPGRAGDARMVSAAFSQDGKTVAAIDQEKGINIFDIASGQRRLAIQTGLDLLSIAFSPDGAYLAGAGRVNFVTVWDTGSGDVAFTLDLLRVAHRTREGQYETIAYSPDGSRLAVAGVIWDLVTGQVLFPLLGHTQGVYAQVFNADGTRLITASFDGTVKIWDLTLQHEVLTLLHPSSGLLYDIAFSPDGKWLATAGGDQAVIVWEARSGERIVTLVGHTDAVNGVDFNVDGTLLATSSADRTVIVWDTRTWGALHILTGHTRIRPDSIEVMRGIMDIAFSPECDPSSGESERCPLAGVDVDGLLVVWDAFDGRVLYTYQDPIGGLRSVAFSPDGDLLAVGTTGEAANPVGSTTLLDADTGQVLRNLFEEGQSGWVHDLAFCPPGGQLAAVNFWGDGKVWDVAGGKVQYSLKGLGGGFSVACNPQGTLLATGGQIGNIVLWEVGSELPGPSLPGPGASPIIGLAFSPDGRYLASAGGDGTARVFVVSPEDLLALARSRLTRDLTLEECQQYLHVDACPAP